MIIVVIVVGYFVWQDHNNFERTIVDNARRQLLETVSSESRSLNRRISDLTQELEILSEDKVVQDAFSYGYGREKEAGFPFLDDSYKDVKSLATSLSMVDDKGRIIYEVPPRSSVGKASFSENDIQKESADHRVYASGIVNTASGTPVLIFDQPVFSKDKFVGLLRAVISLEDLQAVVSRNEKGGRHFFLLDQKDRLLSYPDNHYLGQSLLTILQDKHLSLEEIRFKALMARIHRGEDGSGLCQLFSLDDSYKTAEVIVAFSPVSFGGNTWSLVSAIDYNTIAGPVRRNTRNNISFAGLVLGALFLSALIFYRDQKRKNAELRATQSLLIQSAKLEVIGKLAAGVAHEVKNPLAVIQMSVDYLKNNVKSQDEDVSASLADAENAINRADTIIKGLLDFSASSELEIKTQDVHVLIDRSLSLVKHSREKSNVRVIRNFGKDIPEVSIDRNKIEQVFVNLFMNAIQAMPSGGDLQIRTFRAGSSDKRQMVMVQIEDNGSGMPESILKDLFVPFVTTKRAVGGTGLGLSIVRNIMEMHEGRIALENKTNGRGVRATLWFKI